MQEWGQEERLLQESVKTFSELHALCLFCTFLPDSAERQHAGIKIHRHDAHNKVSD